jgi:hypothetical protein
MNSVTTKADSDAVTTEQKQNVPELVRLGYTNGLAVLKGILLDEIIQIGEWNPVITWLHKKRPAIISYSKHSTLTDWGHVNLCLSGNAILKPISVIYAYFRGT